MDGFRVDRYERGIGRKKALLVLPHWGNRVGGAYRLIPWFLPAFRVTTFHYSSSLLVPSVSGTLQHMRILEDAVITTARHMTSSGVRDVALYGISLGSVLAAHLVRVLREIGVPISHVIFSMIGADFPYAVWHGVKTQSIRRGLEEQGVTLEYLQREWGFLSPAENIELLDGVKILLFVSSYDSVLRPENVDRFVRMVERRYPRASIYRDTFFDHHYSSRRCFFRFHAMGRFLGC
jgi:hypothetical protein